MTPEELLYEMTYENEKQRAEAEKYIALKGIVQYRRVIEFYRSQGQTPTYTKVSSMYRYDKRLRDTLYIYLATAEEFMRACIGNQFEDNEKRISKNSIQFKSNQGRNVQEEEDRRRPMDHHATHRPAFQCLSQVVHKYPLVTGCYPGAHQPHGQPAVGVTHSMWWPDRWEREVKQLSITNRLGNGDSRVERSLVSGQPCPNSSCH